MLNVFMFDTLVIISTRKAINLQRNEIVKQGVASEKVVI